MQTNEHVYFVAIVPPQSVCEEITLFKEDIALRFKSKAALKVIPHITLIAPFVLPSKDHQFVLSWFQNLPVPIKSFEQELNGFHAFFKKRNPVMYVNPVLTSPLSFLQKELLHHFRATYPAVSALKFSVDFHPHITIAYRDLSYPAFEAAWKEYKDKEYKATFEVTNMRLLQHDGRRWTIISTFPLSEY